MLMLRLGSKDVTPATRDAVSQISRFMAMLAGYYNLDREDKLFTDSEEK